MAANKFTVTGLRECIAALDQLDKKIQKKAIGKALRAGAKIVLAEARSTAPVATGNLRKNIKTKVGPRRKAGQSIKVQADVPYIGAVEWGTSKQEGSGFFRAAFDTKKAEASKVMQDELLTQVELLTREVRKS